MGNFDFIFLIIVAVLTTHAHRKRLFFKCQLFYLFNMSCRCFFCFNDISAIHVCAIDITIFGFLDINHLFIIRNAYNSIVSTTQTPRLGNWGRRIKMFYVTITEYVGPNKRDSKNNIIGDSCVAEIVSKCPRTNSSNKRLIRGWLGTTNDHSVTAHGEFNTIKEAREEIFYLGYEELIDNNEFDDDVIESYVSAAAARDQWDADDWFHSCSNHDQTRTDNGITAESSDAEIKLAAEKSYDDALCENVELHGTEELFFELRDEARDTEWENADLDEKINICARQEISIFAARREERAYE